MITVLYFAWMRERMGQGREEVQGSFATVADLVSHLRALDDRHAAAFEDLSAVRIAVDQDLADMATPLANAREVAFFPPMTGG